MTGDARQFALEIDREWLAVQEEIGEKIAFIGLEGLRRVVNKSPVDKGRFKGNWSLTIGVIDTSTTEQVDPAGASTISAGATAVSAYAAYEGFPVIHVQNNLPYGEPLEDGSSTQAPGGMVGLTVAELAAIWDAETL